MCAILIRRPTSDDDLSRRPVLDFSDFTDIPEYEEPPLPDWMEEPEEEYLLWYEMAPEDFDLSDDPKPADKKKKGKKKR